MMDAAKELLLAEARALAADGYTITQVAAELDLHYSTLHRWRLEHGLQFRKGANLSNGLRICCVCKQAKPQEAFSPEPTKATPDRRSTRCKACMAAQNRARYYDPNDPYKQRVRDWRKTEAGNAYHREYYQQLKADPERYAAYLAQQRARRQAKKMQQAPAESA